MVPDTVRSRMSGDLIPEAFAEELVSAARTATGDELRSVTYFTPTGYEQLYLRSDLEASADMDPFVANERLGFASQQTYGETELGEYRSTIRTFEHGYVTRVIVGEAGVFVTTDEMSIDRFEEVGTALRSVLREHGAA